jgi:hypothetical protein
MEGQRQSPEVASGRLKRLMARQIERRGMVTKMGMGTNG